MLLTPPHRDDRPAPARDAADYHITTFAIGGDPTFHILPSDELDSNWEEPPPCDPWFGSIYTGYSYSNHMSNRGITGIIKVASRLSTC